MKNKIIMLVSVFLSLVIVPVAALDFSQFSFDRAKNVLAGINAVTRPQESTAESPNGENDGSGRTEAQTEVKVMAAASGNVISMTELEYVIGCVASEMPATYHEEALKAQAVAAYTNLIRLKQNPDSSLNGADISDSPQKHQGYFTQQQRREKWGENYEKYSQKVEKAVKEVAGTVMTYNSEPIVASYSAMCPGRTESAEVIWGTDIPYLQSISSPGDKLSPDYSSTLIFTKEQFKEIAEKDKDIKLGDDPEKWIGEVEYSKNGTGVIKSIKIGSKTLSGNSARTMFSLRSPSFSVSYANSSFTFKVSGYGHCVGMSQYGADYMARNGSDYKEILKHYYQGVEFTRAVG